MQELKKRWRRPSRRHSKKMQKKWLHEMASRKLLFCLPCVLTKLELELVEYIGRGIAPADAMSRRAMRHMAYMEGDRVAWGTQLGDYVPYEVACLLEMRRQQWNINRQWIERLPACSQRIPPQWWCETHWEQVLIDALEFCHHTRVKRVLLLAHKWRDEQPMTGANASST